MSKYTFLFSGQGAQQQGMVKELCEQYPIAEKTIRNMSEITGENIANLLWNTETSELSRSDKSQLAITAASQAIFAVLKENGIEPGAAAGFSLGEFSALHAAGVLDFETMVHLVQKRGQIMQTACDAIAAESINGEAPGMAAVLKLSPEQVIKTLKEQTEKGIVFPVNMNSPTQTVIAGTAEGLAIADSLCKEAGAKRVLKLAVAGPFHSPLMKRAADDFAKVLESIPFANPTIPLFSNVTGSLVESGDEAKKNAVLHITHPVLWTTIEENLASLMKDGSAWKLLEIGPGATLCGLWRDSGFASNQEETEGFPCSPTGKIDELSTILANKV